MSFEMNSLKLDMQFCTDTQPCLCIRDTTIISCSTGRAKDYLFRSHNMDPEKEENHLVLTKIADIYRDIGLPGDASKLYRLAADRYPAK